MSSSRGLKSLQVPTRILLVFIAAMTILLCTHLAVQKLNISYNEKHGQIFEISNRFDVDDEASVPTWFAQFIWTSVAFSSGLAMIMSRPKAERRVWAILAAVALFFAIDEVSGLHELSLQTIHLLLFGLEQASTSVNAWWLAVPVAVVFGIWFLTKLYKVLRFRAWFILMLGWLIFVAGAMGVELYGAGIDNRVSFYYQGVVVGLEEGLEMLGGIMVLYAISLHLDSQHREQLNRAWGVLRGRADG